MKNLISMRDTRLKTNMAKAEAEQKKKEAKKNAEIAGTVVHEM